MTAIRLKLLIPFEMSRKKSQLGVISFTDLVDGKAKINFLFN